MNTLQLVGMLTDALGHSNIQFTPSGDGSFCSVIKTPMGVSHPISFSDNKGQVEACVHFPNHWAGSFCGEKGFCEQINQMPLGIQAGFDERHEFLIGIIIPSDRYLGPMLYLAEISDRTEALLHRTEELGEWSPDLVELAFRDTMGEGEN